MTRLLSSPYLLALLLCGCTETVTYYEADTAGHWRKSVVNRHLGGYRATAATYVINGITFQYHFQAIGGSAEVRGEGSTHLAPGKWKRAFYKLRGPFLLSTRRVFFSGFIRRVHDASLTTDRLASRAHRAKDTYAILDSGSGPVVVEYREVNGHRWLVTTRFVDRDKHIISNRTYWTIIHSLLVTFSVDSDTSIPVGLEATRPYLDALDRLVSDFRYFA